MGCLRKKLEKIGAQPISGDYRCKKCGITAAKKKRLCKPKVVK